MFYVHSVFEQSNWFKNCCRSLGEIEVGTVDGFQGREKDVIILSCVRANRSGTIG